MPQSTLIRFGSVPRTPILASSQVLHQQAGQKAASDTVPIPEFSACIRGGVHRSIVSPEFRNSTVSPEFDDQFSEACRLYECGMLNEAFAAFLTLAEGGDDSAMTRLACMYEVGEGVDQNVTKSEEWDWRAIRSGSVTAMLNRGITCERSGKIDDARALFEMALNLDDGEAALCLAKLELGEGSSISIVKMLLNKVINSGNASYNSVEEARRILHQYG